MLVCPATHLQLPPSSRPSRAPIPGFAFSLAWPPSRQASSSVPSHALRTPFFPAPAAAFYLVDILFGFHTGFIVTCDVKQALVMEVRPALAVLCCAVLCCAFLANSAAAQACSGIAPVSAGSALPLAYT